MISLEQRHKNIILDILNKYPVSFYAFGSRVKGTNQKFSDLDLCTKDKLSPQDKIKLDEEFEESDLPFKVDIIIWNKISEDFKNLIDKDLVKIV